MIVVSETDNGETVPFDDRDDDVVMMMTKLRDNQTSATEDILSKGNVRSSVGKI